jgi:hypothetical protein
MSEAREQSEYAYWEGYSDALNGLAMMSDSIDYLDGYNKAVEEMS